MTIWDLWISPEIRQIVIPAKAGIQLFQNVLDPGFRRGDNKGRFSKVSSNLLSQLQNSSKYVPPSLRGRGLGGGWNCNMMISWQPSPHPRIRYGASSNPPPPEGRGLIGTFAIGSICCYFKQPLVCSFLLKHHGFRHSDFGHAPMPSFHYLSIIIIVIVRKKIKYWNPWRVSVPGPHGVPLCPQR